MKTLDDILEGVLDSNFEDDYELVSVILEDTLGAPLDYCAVVFAEKLSLYAVDRSEATKRLKTDIIMTLDISTGRTRTTPVIKFIGKIGRSYGTIRICYTQGASRITGVWFGKEPGGTTIYGGNRGIYALPKECLPTILKKMKELDKTFSI